MKELALFRRRFRRTPVGAGAVVLAVVASAFAQTPPQDSPRASTAGEAARARIFDKGFEGKPKILESRYHIPGLLRMPDGGGPKYEAFLREQVCGSDLVVIGIVLNHKSMLNQTETFVFTDYQVHVQQVVRIVRTSIPSTITVSQLGGEVVLDGRLIHAGAGNELVRQGRYLFFLKSLSSGDDYTSGRHLGFIKDEGREVQIYPLGEYSPWDFFKKPLTFLEVATRVRAAAAKCK